jgi:hypothetical protein
MKAQPRKFMKQVKLRSGEPLFQKVLIPLENENSGGTLNPTGTATELRGSRRDRGAFGREHSSIGSGF